jgi:hypothetical protein
MVIGWVDHKSVAKNSLVLEHRKAAARALPEVDSNGFRRDTSRYAELMVAREEHGVAHDRSEYAQERRRRRYILPNLNGP